VARRANGEGSIYHRKDGRWEAAAYVSTASGIRKRVRVYGRTREEAHNKKLAVQAQAQKGIPVPDKSWKLADFLDYWLEQSVRKNDKLTTYERYETVVRLHLKPRLGKFRLVELSVPLVQQFFNEQSTIGRSAATLDNTRKVLRACLTEAERLELVFRNVGRLVRPAKYKPPEARAWTASETDRFLEVVKSDRLYPAFVLLVLYGFRRGELLGLRWCDIDFTNEVLHVRQQVQRTGGKLRLTELKTDASRRDEPLTPVAAQVLADHREKQIAARIAAGHNWAGSSIEDDLIFTTRTGCPIEPRNFSRSFQRIRAQHNLRRIKVHEVRDTNATLQMNLGTPDRHIQAILGHADVNTTRRLYQHSDMGNRRTAVKKVEQRLFWRDTDGGPRCRQLLPSSHKIVDQITSFLFGSGGWTRTTDPRLMRSLQTSMLERATEVNSIVNVRRRQWLLGLVAVSVAVKLHPTSTSTTDV
jgi:integrase